MKKIIVPIVVCLGMMSLPAAAQSEDEGQTTMQGASEEERDMESKYDDVNREQIGAGQLPQRAIDDIEDNYHNGQILRTWRLDYGEDRHGYLVEVEKGPKVWTIEYDEDGNPKNKVLPLKM